MTHIIARPADPSRFGDEGVSLPVSFLQTPFWAQFKASHGWKPFYFILEGEGNAQWPLIALVRRLGRFGSFAYVPMGPHPEIIEFQSATLQELAATLRPYLPKNAICVRFDPPVSRIDSPGKGLIKAGSDIQPPDTVILDLTQNEDEILENMKPKWRYNVRLGEKKGVRIRSLTGKDAADAGMDAFYGLYRETAARDGIAIHDKSYYRDFFLDAAEGPYPVDARLYIASHEGDDIAAIIVLFVPTGATYLYGASSNAKRNLMPAYGLQWRAIRDARAAGCKTYDFYGIPPVDDPTHPMHGLYRFKTGFGGSIVHRCGSYDAPFSASRYALWGVAEKARGLWFKRVKKALTRGIRRRS